MKYWIRVFLAIVISVIAITACAWALYRLIRTGTCASGGPYVSAQPCPSGTGLQIMALVGGIFGLLIGIGIYTARGQTSPPARGSRKSFAAVGFSLLMLSMAAACLLAAFGPASTGEAGPQLGGGIAAGVLLLIGLPPLLFGWRSLAGSGPVTFSMPTPPATIATPPPRPPTPAQPRGDALSKLEQLGELRRSGVLTEEEFQRQKRELLGN